MASPISPAARKEDLKEEFLTCSICTETYDNDKHQAKCLPCLHTYCKSCLERLAGKRSKFDCPKCRKLIPLPDKTVESLPNNFIVENLKDYQDIFNLAVSCGSCHNNKAVSFCHDCGIFLCQTCVDAHTQLGPLQQHQLSTMVELQEQRYNPRTQQQQHCRKHPKQDITMYCRETDCKVPVCATCGLLDHRGHELIELSAAIGKIITDMQQASARVNEKNQQLTQKGLRIERMQKALSDNYNKKKKEIEDSIQTMHNHIDSIGNKAQTKLKRLYETELSSMTSNMESVDFLKAQVTSACEFANQACHNTNSTQLLTSQNQIMDRLVELQKTKLPETGSDKTDFAFTDKHHSALAQINESIQPLYETMWLRNPGKKQVPNKQLKVRSASQQKSAPSTASPIPALSETKLQVDPQRCTIQLGLPGMNQFYRKAIIQTVDSTGKKMTTGGAKVDVTQGGASLQVQDNNYGTYTFEYYLCDVAIQVMINGMPVKGSPFNPL